MKSIRAQAQFCDQDQSMILSPLEYSLFQWLKLHRGDVISRETLLKNVWGFQSNGDTRTVDMCVQRLRKKIGAEQILTVHGKGYLMPA